MENKNDIEINIKDIYGDNCLVDSNVKNNKSSRSPKGFVEIYEVDKEGNKKLVGKNNLVLYRGREWLAQRMMNINNLLSIAPSSRDQYITWLGLGDGGVTLGDPFNPNAPIMTDVNLGNEIMINATDSSSADYRLLPEAGYFKLPFDSVEFETDELNDDTWLVVKITVTVKTTDANDKQLSEAGLFTASSSDGGHTGPFNLFARVTFPSIVKTSDRRLILTWYLYV